MPEAHPSPRILILPRQVPYLRNGGSKIRNYWIAKLLGQIGTVDTFCVHIDEHSGPPAGEEGHWHEHALTLTPKRAAYALASSLRRRQSFVSSLFYHPRVEAALERFLHETQPDVVVFSEVWHASYFPLVRRHAKKFILDLHNIEEPLYRKILLKPPFGWANVRNFLLWSAVRRVEERMIKEADEVWVCSESDREKLESTYPGAARSVRVAPNIIDPSDYNPLPSPALAAWAPGPTIIFCANFVYWPNKEAAHVLLQEVLPLLREHDLQPRLLLVGHCPTRTMQRMAAVDPSVIVTGLVPDVRPYLAAADVVVVPLRQGGGTRLKVLEAFAARRAVVSTQKGMEGLHAEHQRHALVASSPEEIADAIERLWRDPRMAHALTQNAYDLLSAAYGPAAMAARLRESVASLTGASLS